MNNEKRYEESLIGRFMMWIHERFPLRNTPFFFLLFIVSYAVAVEAEKKTFFFSWNVIAGCLASWSCFLLIRIFDEHKDYLIDCTYHPERVLQRGVITLRYLKIAGIACIALQLVISMAVDRGIGGGTIAWGLMFIWICLMGKEFFVGNWLNQYFTLYAITHMLVMPLIIWWLANIAIPGVIMSTPVKILMLLSFIAGFVFEITRKYKGPDEERESIPTYSSLYGIKTVFTILVLLVSIMLFIQIWLLHATTGNVSFLSLMPLAIFYLLSLYQLTSFLYRPCARNRKRNEAIISLYMTVGYLDCAITIFNHISV